MAERELVNQSKLSPPDFLRQLESGTPPEEIEGLEKIGSREGLSLVVREGNQSYLLIETPRLKDLLPAPETQRSVDIVVDGLINNRFDTVVLTGAMRSDKSEVFNQSIREIYYHNIETQLSLPMMVCRARRAREKESDSIKELEQELGDHIPFNYEIDGPLDILRLVNERNRGINVVGFEEAGMLVISRRDYIHKYFGEVMGEMDRTERTDPAIKAHAKKN